MQRRRHVAALFVTVASTFSLAPTSAAEPPSRTCELPLARSSGASSATCLSCHPRSSAGAEHPVGLDYETAQRGSRGFMGLRPAAEVVARGVFLPGGKVECGTCHDPQSPWKDHLALPPGARATPAVDPRDPAKLEEDAAPAQRERALQAPPPGQRAAVSAKPLCLACHAAD